MTIRTNGNNVRLMFNLIAFMMMIMFSLLATIPALEIMSRKQFALLNCVIDNGGSNNSIRIFGLIAFLCSLTLFALPIFNGCTLTSYISRLAMVISFGVFFVVKFALWILIIIFATFYAPNLITISFTSMFMKLRKWFIFLAFRASFRYDFDSHNRFLHKRFWLELFAGPIPVFSSLYYMMCTLGVKTKQC